MGALVCLALLAASCGDVYLGDLYADVGGTGSSSSSSGDGGGGAAANGCGEDSVCMPLGEGQGPFLVWMGPKGMAPPTAPARADWRAVTGAYMKPIIPGCGTCTCGALDHTCGLPTSLTAYDAPGCPAGLPGQSFDAASPWSGTCDDNNPIPAPNNVQSLLVAALDLVETCKPSTSTPGPLDWELEAVAFGITEGITKCVPDLAGYRCLPKISEPGDPPEGFHLCMMNEGVLHQCIDNGAGFTELHVIYREFEDTRTCDPCTCTPPVAKGTCSSFLSIYKDVDTSCNGPEVTPGIGISSDSPTCFPINPAKQPLGSKHATPPQYTPALGEPGCQPGGGALHGSAVPSTTATKSFCCLPSKQPYHPSDHQ